MGRHLTVPNSENASLAELETAMHCTPCRRAALRIRAIWALFRGMHRADVALFCNIDEKTLLDWINGFNSSGIDGLIDRERKGAPRKIERQKVLAEIIPLLDAPAIVGQQHWTAVKLHGHLTTELKMQVSYPTLVRYLHDADRCLKVPHPMPEPPDKDLWLEQREAFKIRLAEWMADDSVQLWFGDESGIEGDPRPRKRWVEKGSRPTLPYAGSHLRRNVIGAVSPTDGQLSCLIFSHCDTEVFQAFLDNLAREVPADPNRKHILILDNASWHKAKSLNPHHFQIEFLPPYSPDFNPIERFWLRLKSDFFSDFFAKTPDDLEDRIILGLRSFFAQPEKVASNCSISANF